MNNIVAPITGNHGKKSKGKRKVTTRKHNSRTRKSSETSRPNSSTSRRSHRSPKPRKHQKPEERHSRSKRKRQVRNSKILNDDVVNIYISATKPNLGGPTVASLVSVCLWIEWSVFKPWPGTLCCVLGQDTTLTVLHST